MDASALTTITAASGAGLDPAAVVGILVALLALFGAPWWVTLAARLGAGLLLGRRGGPGVKVEPAPDPVSDGGAAADRELPAAVAGAGGPREVSDGGAAEDRYLPEAHPEVTAPIGLKRHSGDAG